MGGNTEQLCLSMETAPDPATESYGCLGIESKGVPLDPGLQIDSTTRPALVSLLGATGLQE